MPLSDTALATAAVIAAICFLAFVGLLVIGLCAAAGRKRPDPPRLPSSSNRKAAR